MPFLLLPFAAINLYFCKLRQFVSKTNLQFLPDRTVGRRFRPSAIANVRAACWIFASFHFTIFMPSLFSFSDYSAYPTIRALVNGSVSLPCNISQTKEENSIKLILWYKNSILGTPIYSIDARDTNISQARHFLGPSYTGRASFELNLAARLALLAVNYLSAEDDGHYICRVDFRYSRTTISTVKLDVIGEYKRTDKCGHWPFLKCKLLVCQR